MSGELQDPHAGLTTRPVAAGALLIGVGLGGFVDGIVFHQILQLHNMLSAKLKPDTVVRIEVNMFWDGLFHAFCWVSVVAGLAVLWNAVLNPAVAKRTGTLCGGLLAGFGLFNLVEGTHRPPHFAPAPRRGGARPPQIRPRVPGERGRSARGGGVAGGACAGRFLARSVSEGRGGSRPCVVNRSDRRRTGAVRPVPR